MTRSNLHGLTAAGVSVWSDSISREMLDSGELERRITEDAVTGVTSNPSIFEKAIVDTSDYDSELSSLKEGDASAAEIVKTMMATDLMRACDLLDDVFAATEGTDGLVSVEVSPTLARDTEATIAEARDWAKQINKRNLLIKVPATPEGIPAIEHLTAEGISINITLIFSLERYRQVMDAYMSGLERLADAGGDISTVFSVASFFVSRFDTEVDRRLEEIGSDEALELRGLTAVANARAAYGDYLVAFSSERFRALEEKRARRQKPLWASTSTKNPEYSDLLYLESLVAPNTVNTMPLDTIDAYQDHGDPSPDPFTGVDIERARVDLARLQSVGVDYADVVQTLEDEGVDKFIASWEELLGRVDEA